jgi:ABC-type Co2+ transport system permease subunit
MKILNALLTKTVVFSLVLAAVSAILKYTGAIPAIHDQWYLILLFYFILTAFIFYQLLRSIQKTPRKFIVAFLGMSALRIVLFTAIILLYAFVIQPDNVQDTVRFILTFAAYYIFFTVWEVVLMVPVLKNLKAAK